VSVSFHWNNFLWPLIITNSVTSRPVTVGLQVFSSGDQGIDWSVITAATLMTSAPLLIAFLLFQRQFVQSFMRAESAESALEPDRRPSTRATGSRTWRGWRPPRSRAKLLVRNVRNFAWRGETDRDPRWEDRSYDLEAIRLTSSSAIGAAHLPPSQLGVRGWRAAGGVDRDAQEHGSCYPLAASSANTS
jgi:hypothetical protein